MLQLAVRSYPGFCNEGEIGEEVEDVFKWRDVSPSISTNSNLDVSVSPDFRESNPIPSVFGFLSIKRISKSIKFFLKRKSKRRSDQSCWINLMG